MVVTPRIDQNVKYKHGDWHRYTAEADDPDRNLKGDALPEANKWVVLSDWP